MQRATFGVEQVTSQCRPREFMVHDVVPIALPTLWLLLVLLVVPLEMLVSLSPLVLLLWVLMLVLLLLTRWSTLMLLEVEAAPAPVTAKHSRTARLRGNLMMDSQGTPAERIFGSAPKKKGPKPPFTLARQVRPCPCLAAG